MRRFAKNAKKIAEPIKSFAKNVIAFLIMLTYFGRSWAKSCRL